MAEIFTVTRLEIDEPEHCKYLLLSHPVPVTHRFVICAAGSLHVHALIRTSEDPRTCDHLEESLIVVLILSEVFFLLLLREHPDRMKRVLIEQPSKGLNVSLSRLPINLE